MCCGLGCCLDNMKMAREKANIGMLTSDVDTAPSDVERAKSRERRHKKRFSELDESDGETDIRQLLTKPGARSASKKSGSKASLSTITEPAKKRPNLLPPPPVPQIIHNHQLSQSVRSPFLPDLPALDETDENSALWTSEGNFMNSSTASQISPGQAGNNTQTPSRNEDEGIPRRRSTIIMTSRDDQLNGSSSASRMSAGQDVRTPSNTGDEVIHRRGMSVYFLV